MYLLNNHIWIILTPMYSERISGLTNMVPVMRSIKMHSSKRNAYIE